MLWWWVFKQQHTCRMSVVPLLSKRTHLRSPTAAAFLRSKGVSRGLGVVLAMSVPAGTAIMHVTEMDLPVIPSPQGLNPQCPVHGAHEGRHAMWVAPEAALRKPTTGLGGVLSLVVSLRRVSLDNIVLRLGMPFFSLVIAGHPNPTHDCAELVQNTSAKNCNLHSVVV